jgi:hypothetical protein
MDSQQLTRCMVTKEDSQVLVVERTNLTLLIKMIIKRVVMELEVYQVLTQEDQ